jgi:hypothetical protein
LGYSLNPQDNRTRRRGDPEQQLQEFFVAWLWQNNILHCAIPGGMRTNIGTAMKMKRAGYRKGFPDMIIPVARHDYHGLFVELKCRTYPTPEQNEWHRILKENGYEVIINPAKLDFYGALGYLIAKTEAYLGDSC